MWVAGFGVARLTAELARTGDGITVMAVYGWLSGAAAPRLRLAARIVDLSNGGITLEDVAAHRAALVAQAPTSASRERPAARTSRAR
jgi:hypothetical protein